MKFTEAFGTLSCHDARLGGDRPRTRSLLGRGPCDFVTVSLRSSQLKVCIQALTI
jgi:hypothetical protein